MTNDAGFPLESLESVEPPKRTRAALRRTRPERTAAAAAGGGRAAGLFGWLVSPGVYLALGCVFSAGLLLCLYNPSWGAFEARWPHEVYALEDGLFVFGPADAHVTALLLAALGCLAALFCKPGPVRGTIAAVGAGALVAAYAPDRASDLWQPAWLPFLGIAAIAGALVARAGTQVEGRRRILLGAGVVALGAALFFPAGGTAYASPGLDHIDALTGGTDFGALVSSLPLSVGLVLLAVGLLAGLGLGGAWARWTAGGLILVLALAAPLDGYFGGSGSWSERLGALASAEVRAPWVWLLPLTAALASWLQPRRN